MRADGCYGECLCKRRATLKGAVCKSLLIFGVVLMVLLAFVVSPWLLLLAFVLGYVATLVWGRMDVTYEYVFVDGQLDFDRIFGGEARKRAKRIDFETVEIIAPVNSHALDGYQHLDVKPIDFSSLIHDEEHKVYMIINKAQNATEKILFEPDEKMLALMKSKAPRKIVEY